MDRTEHRNQTRLDTCHPRSRVSIRGNLQRTGPLKPNDRATHNRNRICYRYCLGLLSVILSAPVNAETIGGVSATASPTATSSGSVTNQAVQIMNGNAIQNSYGGGIQCQGPTLTFSPYVNGSQSFQTPYEAYYDEPVYDLSDLNGDGLLDNPGSVLYTMPTRTGQKDSNNWSGGLALQLTIPLDGGLQARCKEAADAQIALQEQYLANKRLDFEIARLKNCGELKQKGIEFHPRSPYYSVCADVILRPKPGQVIPHKHKITSVTPAELSGAQTQTKP